MRYKNKKEKIFLEKINIWILKLSSKIENYLRKKDSNFSTKKFASLIPDIENLDENEKKNMEKYSDILESRINDKNVLNIALTGGYSSGKSTILRYFKYRNSHIKFLDISLAEFEDDEVIPDIHENLKELESKILQQMFYSVKRKTIPFSRFSKIEEPSRKLLAAKVLYWIIWIVIPYYKFTGIEITKGIEILRWFYFGMSFINLSYISYKIVLWLYKFRFSKVKIGNTGAEVEGSKEDNIFNRHLDEILYFFQKTQISIVVFEDLDRFKNSHRLFTKLRELNRLINNSKQVEKEVTFIYALKDDIFSNENDRTKFFDFIIPVVPIAHFSNSERFFIEKKNTLGLKGLDTRFLKDISLYIDDLRMIKNIFNELLIYKEQVFLNQKKDNRENNSINQDRELNNLLAIVIYKNLFPQDFSALLKKEGMVYSVFQKKKEFIEDKNLEVSVKINLSKKKILRMNDEYLQNLEELNTLYIYDFIKETGIVTIEQNRARKLVTGIDKAELFKSIQEKRVQGFNQNGYAINNLEFSKLEKVVSPTKTYEERKESLEGGKENNIRKIQEEIKTLTKKKAEIRTYRIKDFLEEESSEDEIDKIFTNCKNKDILLFLLREGHIDESYDMYISYLNPEAITEKDAEFLRSIKNKKALDFNFVIDKIDRIFENERLAKEDFSKMEILNFSLFEYLMENHSGQNQVFYEKFIEQIVNEKEKSVKFIEEFIQKLEIEEERLEKFINILFKNWDNMLKYLEENKDGTTIIDKSKYIYLILKYISVEDIEKNVKVNKLKKILSSEEEFSKYCESYRIEEEKIKELLTALKVKFNILNFTSHEDKIFEYILENNYYIISLENIETILKYKNKNTYKLTQANWSTVRESGIKPLVAYLENDPKAYFDNVLVTIKETNIEEDEAAQISLLNNSKLEIEDKEIFITNQKGKIENLCDIEEIDLYRYMLDDLRVEPNWKNLIEYYEKNNSELDETLEKYLNLEENYLLLSEEKIPNKDSFKEVSQNIQLKISADKNITENSFKNLAKSFSWLMSDYDFDNISNEKLEILIENKKIYSSVNIFKILKERKLKNYLELLLVANNMSKFLDEQDKYGLNSNEWSKLLKSRTDEENKIKMIETYDLGSRWVNSSMETLRTMWEIIFRNKELKISKGFINNLIKDEIIKLSPENFEYLKQREDGSESILIQANLDKFLIEYEKYKINEKYEIEFLEGLDLEKEMDNLEIDGYKKIGELILNQKDLGVFEKNIRFLLELDIEGMEKEKLELLYVFMDILEREDLELVLNKITGVPEEYNKILITKGGQGKLPISEINFKILEKLKKKDYISNFKENKEKSEIIVNRKRGHGN